MKFLVIVLVLSLELELFLEHPRYLGQLSLLFRGNLQQPSSEQGVLQKQEMKAQGRWQCSNAQVSKSPHFRNRGLTNPFIPIAPVLLHPQVLRPGKIHTVRMPSGDTFSLEISWLCDFHERGAGTVSQTLPASSDPAHVLHRWAGLAQ